ncbi:TPA: hypothetical protein JXS40_003612 [Escherichia coli]|uniref:Uncharacterized protein n=2 Tax=Gammaproteobacteria TaxID=1236 RepID=A0A8S7XWP4_ECOLX|nr:hypothetical protein [Escherichia albertii]EER2978380.1 hypothetical protein [Escherichia coli]EFQ1092888.1 hypothetical protein [Shigella sonnei]EFY9622396.1 hypothetical protein [Shigella flexneri]HAI1401269.1 hypothetical protein [Escherichia coli O25b:H4-ST131]HAX0011422.1 hypothetical protein [Escherichia coli JJ2668]HAX0152146.1 hypothetical protein [Escherichia coli MVAST131]HAX0170985.1 hypothetical protein [Escherichia coli MVAST084]
MHKSVAGEFQKEVDNTTVLLDDILSILALLEAGDWSEHCTKTELGGRLEREITRLIGDAQEATVTGYELIAEAWRLMDGQDPKTSDWHSKASKYLNSNIVEKVDDDRIEAVKAVLRRLAGNSPVTPDGHIQFSVSLPAAFGGDKYFIDGVFQPLRYERDCERAVVAAGGVVNWVK